jgi:hypothetical protein
MLKRIAIQDDLVAAIVNMRAAQIQSFGRPQPDKYSTGFKIVPTRRPGQDDFPRRRKPPKSASTKPRS